MNTKPKIDEIKVLAPVRAAMRGWHSCDRAGLARRIHDAWATVVGLVDAKRLPRYSATWYKACREVTALEDRLWMLDNPNYRELFDANMAAIRDAFRESRARPTPA